MAEEPGSAAGSGWTEQEINASVDAWVKMHRMQQDGSPFVKAEIVRSLQENDLGIRSRSSVEHRFMNISAVSLALEHEIVQGFQPLGNVGKTNWKRIQSRLETHGFGIDDIEASIEEEMAVLMQSGLEGFEASRMKERAWQKVTQRSGQSRFRTMLLDAYDNRCAVTRLNEPVVLEAAHIEPYSGAASNVAQNGLILKSDIHKLFDRGLLVIQPDLTTMLAPSLQNGSYAIHEGQRIHVPEREAFKPSPRLLEIHMDAAMINW
jgi:hypothetical protein